MMRWFVLLLLSIMGVAHAQQLPPTEKDIQQLLASLLAKQSASIHYFKLVACLPSKQQFNCYAVLETITKHQRHQFNSVVLSLYVNNRQWRLWRNPVLLNMADASLPVAEKETILKRTLAAYLEQNQLVKAKGLIFQLEALSQRTADSYFLIGKLFFRLAEYDPAIQNLVVYVEKFTTQARYAGEAEIMIIQAKKARQHERQTFEQLGDDSALNALLTRSGLASVASACFDMGSERVVNEQPVHQQCVANFKWMTKLVSHRLWGEVMGYSANIADETLCGAECAVNNVNLDEINRFLATVNRYAQHTFRLPTEAEWEYMCQQQPNNMEHYAEWVQDDYRLYQAEHDQNTAFYGLTVVKGNTELPSTCSSRKGWRANEKQRRLGFRLTTD